MFGLQCNWCGVIEETIQLTYESSEEDQRQRTNHHDDHNEWTEWMLIQHVHFK